MDPLTEIIKVIYYLAVAVLVFFSVFGVYVLLRYGRDRFASLIAAIFYSLFFLILLQQSYSALLALNS